MLTLLHYLLFLLTLTVLSLLVRRSADELALLAPERRGHTVGSGRRSLLWLLCLLLPWTMPSEVPALRIIATGYAIIFALESHELVRGRVPDWQLIRSSPGFLLWWLVPLDVRDHSHPSQRARARRLGRRRCFRGLAKLGLAALLFGINHVGERSWSNPWLLSAWSMPTLYSYLSGVADLVTGTAMLTGVDVEEAFDNPWISRNPTEFWGRRWNRFVTNFARRHVFWPFGGLRKPVRATMAIFVGSGLAHEYMLVCCRDSWSPYFGWTLLFFSLHGVAVVFHGRWQHRRRRQGAQPWPPTLAISAHVLWMWLTSPLFFVPLADALGYLNWF